MTHYFPIPGTSAFRARRGATFRKAVLAMAVAGAVAVGGVGGYIYYRNNSVTQLASRAQLALEQNDPAHAVDYLQRALAKHPHGETGVGLRLLMARALLEQEREQDAREYLNEALAEKKDSYDALDLLARTYVTPIYATLRKKPKPISPVDAQALYQQIDANLDTLINKMPSTARNLVAQAELHRLSYMILNDQSRQALAQRDAATLSQNVGAANEAQKQLVSAQQPLELHRKASIDKLEAALKAEPTHAAAASLLSQYEFQDKQFDRAVALYEQMKKRDAAALPEEVALSAARSILADTTRQADKGARFNDARALLEEYLHSHPKSVRTMVALGDVLLDQGQVAEAAKLGERAAAESPNELFAQILLVNCRLREKKTEEALRLISPLTTAFDNRPEVWYLQGLASIDAGDAQAAENAFRKAFAVSPAFIQARRALLELQNRSGNTEGASLTASQILREDRYDMPAWNVTAESLRKHGQMDRARQVLVGLAADQNVPMESRPELVRMLAYYGAGNEAQALLATLPKDDKTTLNLRALVAASRGNGVDARNLMAQAVAADPQDIDLRLRYAEMLAQAGLAADFRAQLDEIVASNKNLTADQTLSVARNYLRVRLPAQAASLLKPLIDKHTAIPEARELAQQAQAMLAGGQTNADPAAGMDIDLRTAAISDLVRYAASALQQKKYEVALSVARAGTARDRANSAFHQIAARALAGLNQIDQAVEEAAAAAALEPNRPEGYQTFVELFPTADAAIKGLTYGNRFDTLNASFGAWAAGQLAEVTGQYDLALKYYNSGLEAANRLIDSRPAKDQLYQAVINLHATRKDPVALKKAADALAQADAGFAPGIRLLACDKLTALGDRQGAAQELEAIAAKLGKSPQPRLVLSVANRWLTLQSPDKALSLMEAQVAAAPNEPEFLDAYAMLLAQTGKLDKALEVRTKLVSISPGEPQYRVLLSNVQAASGDLPAAFRTLDDAAGLGATGKQLAKSARIQQLISLGLLSRAGDELKTGSAASGNDDFASMLAVAQAWAQLNKLDEARKMANAIPSYAAQYTGAQVLIATMDLDKGDHAAAIKSLTDLLSRNPNAGAQIAPSLFLAYLRAGDAKSALELAARQKAMYLDNTPQSRSWTTLAATAARESGQYDSAIRTLEALDPDSRRAAAFDIALMQLLQNKPEEAAAAAASLPDDGPAFNRSTLQLLAGKPVQAATRSKMLKEGLLSTVLAVLSATPQQDLPAALQQASQNLGIFPGDLEDLGKRAGKDGAATMRTLSLAQRLMEAGWSTTTLSLADSLDKQTPNLAAVGVLRHQALSDLHRTAEANAVRDAIAARATSAPDTLTPSLRVLLAAAWAKDEKYNDAIAVLQPLAASKRTDILTTLATLHEKNGQLDQAIALHRQVRTLEPDNISAANNLAYTLVASNPTDKAAIAEARKAIEFAISRAPQVTAFQDTLGWIEILSGQAADGTRRIARVASTLRLDPAVHYHLGMGYAQLGQNDFAKMHLQNVAHLAQNHKNIPELPLATEALRTLASTQ